MTDGSLIIQSDNEELNCQASRLIRAYSETHTLRMLNILNVPYIITGNIN